MTREIKFRAWHPLNKEMVYPINGQNFGYGGYTRSDILRDFEDENIMQYTGLKDKTGKEIYEGDVVAVRNKMGDNSEYETYCAYSVNTLNHEGFEMIARKLLGDNPNNQHPIHQTLSFRSRSLCTDYRNSNYDRLAIEETHGENHTYSKTWKQNQYSNDMEVIGNVYENPNLLTT